MSKLALAIFLSLAMTSTALPCDKPGPHDPPAHDPPGKHEKRDPASRDVGPRECQDLHDAGIICPGN